MTTAKAASQAPPEDLARLAAECVDEKFLRLFKQPGGLSPRQFFRAERASGEAVMVMWLPEDAPERVLARRLGRRLPFLEIRELLENARVRVPRLFGARPEQGILVVEDLGETLAERLRRTPSERDALYGRAVRDLAAAQQALAVLPEGSIVGTRGFDRELLTWEVEHFREWGVEALGVTLSDAEQSAFARATSYLVDTITSLPQGFVHRDYQSRNLLVLADEIGRAHI